MIFICVLFGFSLIYWSGWSEKQLCKHVGDGVILQPLIMYRKTRFALKGVAFLFVKDVLGFWNSGYSLFLIMEKCWKQQEDKASSQR